MAGLRLEHIYKVYPNGTKAVSDFTMDIKDKEFIVFVGPSGCGKSTTLRMIAGLEEISAGELYIDNHIVNDVEPKDRDIAMVFQNYALYPHMTVYENIAFGLRIKKMPESQIREKVNKVLELVELSGFQKRMPDSLSGGQQQRIAIARALLRPGSILLLDEFSSALDADTEVMLMERLTDALSSHTMIFITHRDKIIDYCGDVVRL